MAFVSTDQRALYLPLIDGVAESPPWSTFMHNLLAHTRAGRALLILSAAQAPSDQKPTVLQFAAPRALRAAPLDPLGMNELGLPPFWALRPDRVYALEEMLDFGNPDRLAAQRRALDEMGIRHGRWLRVSAGPTDACIVIAREREDFAASASATLSAIAPLFAAALRIHAKFAEQRLQGSLAQSALGRIGVGQLAFGRDGRVLAADPRAEALLAIADDPSGRVGRRLQLRSELARRVDEACAAIADGGRDAETVIPLDRDGLFLLLRSRDPDAPRDGVDAPVIGTIRQPAPGDARKAIATIAAVHGLSAQEAALAHGIASGETIVEAGTRLSLTPETSRIYSKRIYSKTGTRGQADLVRLLLSGLAPFA